jgi:cardiolipin synthase A/B
MQGIVGWVREFGPVLISIVYVAGATGVTMDAVLRKRHVPAIVGWVGLAWLAPVIGALAYYLLGINRIRRSASALARKAATGTPSASPCGDPDRAHSAALEAMHTGFAGLARLGGKVTGRWTATASSR